MNFFTPERKPCLRKLVGESCDLLVLPSLLNSAEFLPVSRKHTIRVHMGLLQYRYTMMADLCKNTGDTIQIGTIQIQLVPQCWTN